MHPLAIQLYTLRTLAAKDPQATLAAVANAGYLGVECAGFWGWSPREFRRRVEDLGMRIAGSHSPWCRPDTVQSAIETAGELGLDVVAGGYGPEQFKDIEAIHKTCDEINLLCDRVERAGLRMYIHNHAWEFNRFDGRLGHEIVLQRCPRVLFEIDLYWAANFGAEDPAKILPAFAHRAPFLHVKDGSLVRDQANTAVGDGVVDLAAAIRAAEPRVLRWLIVEMDRCDTDLVTAIRRSRDWLVGKGLAVARPPV
jgi:sugar phosphate isomerase/epimerase